MLLQFVSWGTTRCSNLTGTGYPPLRDPLGFLSTPNAESLKLTGAQRDVPQAGTFPACGWLCQREVLVYSPPLAALLATYLGFSIFTLRLSPRRPRGEGLSHTHHEV